MKQRGFVGWYVKHQKGNTMLAFIPGTAESGAFVQMLSPEGSRRFPVADFSEETDGLRAGNCRFSHRGCVIDLPGVRGELIYGKLTPLKSDIMGPFRFLPMECRHGVISMSHGVRGSVTVDGKEYSFDGGTGYLEMDRGSSFPRDYLWVQCNDFPEKCGVMAAVARIPFCGGHFRGCICAIVYRGREYRLATYRGARVRRADGGHICLTQGALCLKMDMKPRNSGCPLDAPRQGRMTGTIRESCNADLRVRLWERGKPVLDLKSGHAAYEFVPPSGRAR